MNEREYLTAQLGRDPATHAPAIMKSRAKALRLNKPTASSSVETHRRRWAKAKEALDALRKRVWTAPLADLEAELTKLPSTDFPDVAHAAERLRAVVAHRDKLPPLTQHKDFWADFFNVFKEILVAPPQEVAVLRERCVGQFRYRKHQKQGKKMIALLQQQVPELAAMEADWLNTLTRQRATTGLSEKNIVVEAGNGPPIWLYIFILITVLRFLGNLFGGK